MGALGTIFRTTRRHAWVALLAFTICVWLFPIGCRAVRLCLLVSVQCLRQYEGARYLWGGESRMGIDCSGLVRNGLINANIKTGFLTCNPQLVRTAVALWWNDCSAQALRDEFRGFTTRLARSQSINSIADGFLEPGDLAVAANGVHVLAFLGGKTWIEADPDAKKVIAVQAPSDNVWLTVPVQLVRWTQLKKTPNRLIHGIAASTPQHDG